MHEDAPIKSEIVLLSMGEAGEDVKERHRSQRLQCWTIAQILQFVRSFLWAMFTFILKYDRSEGDGQMARRESWIKFEAGCRRNIGATAVY